MTVIWDIKADAMNKGDRSRDVSPLMDKTYTDKDGFTHYVFSKVLFNNPYYEIPDDELELFKKFLDGGSRAYPSDGSIPCDVVAAEARELLNRIVEISNDPKELYCDDACECLEKGKFSLIRGTIKLYLGKYTTRDWRRKRFTDDIDFWVFKVHLLEHVLRNLGWIKNKNTGEWEKRVNWINPDDDKTREAILCAANNLNQLLDFGAGSFLEGSTLREIFNKKIKRGHNVDLSDIINVALHNDGIIGRNKDEWNDSWVSFEEAANTRNSRTTSNLISLSRYSLAIADYLERVSQIITKYHEIIFDKNEYPDDTLKRICRTSIHWIEFLRNKGSDKARSMIHDYLIEQSKEKSVQARNLKNFANKILELLNSKYEYQNIIFEIENNK
ncbi:MAG: hypothetical protein ACFE8J_01850 [Candidatus Heimdallarchaeota archaeon]